MMMKLQIVHIVYMINWLDMVSRNDGICIHTPEEKKTNV
jgi:hypothetical protein